MNDVLFDKNRVINFSDAIFSIVMTLLVLEVAVPTAKELSLHNFGDVLSTRIPDFIGLFVSFKVSALYWISHLKIFKYVSEITTRLLWINIYFLLAIVLLPFSTAMFVNGFNLTGTFMFYCLNLALIAGINLVMLIYVFRKEKEQTGLDNLHYKALRNRGLNVLFIWIIAALFSSFWYFSRFLFILLFANQFLIDRYYKKKISDKTYE